MLGRPSSVTFVIVSEANCLCFADLEIQKSVWTADKSRNPPLYGWSKMIHILPHQLQNSRIQT